MSDAQWQRTRNAAKVVLAFVNAFAGILAAYPGPELPALARLLCAATVAGCGAALLILNPPGSGRPDDATLTAMADELEKRRRERVESRLRGVGNDG